MITTTPIPNTTPIQQKIDLLSTSQNVSNSIFNKFNIIFLIWFLAIYLVIYFILGIFYDSSSGTSTKLVASRIFDFLVLMFFLIVIVFQFLTLSDSDKEKVIGNNFSYLKDYINTLATLVYLTLFLIVFYAIIYLTGIPMTYSEKPITITIIEGFVWILFALVLIANFCKYVIGISIADLMDDWINTTWNTLPDTSGNKVDVVKKDASGNTVKKDASGNTVKVDASGVKVDLSKNEVFNIANNIYSYQDARAVCKVYGAELATYDQIEKSYNDGGEWCNYGWSENQMIFFPTQLSTWNTLQKDPKKKNNCGRPGINGGYIENPYVTFGVNCYGKKPSPSEKDLNQMKQNSITPKTAADLALDEKMKYWMDHSANLLNINAFNSKKWSEY